MNIYPIVSIAIALILVVLLVVLVVYKRKRGGPAETDYRVFFILGITWLPMGIATDNPAFWGMGAVFLIIGLANRDKWKEEKKWSNMSPSERNIRLLIVIGLVLVFVAAIAVYFLAQR